MDCGCGIVKLHQGGNRYRWKCLHAINARGRRKVTRKKVFCRHEFVIDYTIPVLSSHFTTSYSVSHSGFVFCFVPRPDSSHSYITWYTHIPDIWCWASFTLLPLVVLRLLEMGRFDHGKAAERPAVPFRAPSDHAVARLVELVAFADGGAS
jgi:hypothetical protein